jgi:hydroxymethylpyrimidine kinase/phosphomethylpyrimidine kinase/thiamine-phosphate diphosphorylase
MNSNLIIISSPENIPSEIRMVISLLKQGLQQFHIRKPEFTDFDMLLFITSIPKSFHKFLVLHSHYYLAKDFGLKGIQVGVNRVAEAKEYTNSFTYFGYSAHSFDEIIENKHQYTHFFLSPVFNSISKKGYKSNFNLSDISGFLQENQELKITALGGINKNNCRQCMDIGFSGIALLGAIWQESDVLNTCSIINEALNSRAYTMSIAGFDPSSGAGVSADIKTFEQHEVQGLAVSTAITYQNESEFIAVDWLRFEQIKKQIEVFLKKQKTQYVKIVLIENFEVLRKIISLLKQNNPKVNIIWDPILKASANFSFHQNINKAEIIDLLKDIYLITPNLPECKELFGTNDFVKIQSKINDTEICKTLIKGGHAIGDDVSDVLIENNTITQFNEKKLLNKDKHGTGCVLSSAICSNLSKGIQLHSSIEQAKNYITKFIDSNHTLLGFHKTN